MTPNRIATLLMAASGALAAIAVPVANLDASSTAGVFAGLTAIAAAFATWMQGWRAHEARTADHS